MRIPQEALDAAAPMMTAFIREQAAEMVDQGVPEAEAIHRLFADAVFCAKLRHITATVALAMTPAEGEA